MLKQRYFYDPVYFSLYHCCFVLYFLFLFWTFGVISNFVSMVIAFLIVCQINTQTVYLGYVHNQI